MSKKRRAIVVDIDGTLADMGKGQPDRRGPYDWDRVAEDDPKADVIDLVQLMLAGRNANDGSPFIEHLGAWDLVLTSGRKEKCRIETKRWLWRQGIYFDYMFMRPDNDNRPDHQLKLDIYKTQIEPVWNVWVVLDDRDQVVKMWRDQGLTCLQVAEGNF